MVINVLLELNTKLRHDNYPVACVDSIVLPTKTTGDSLLISKPSDIVRDRPLTGYFLIVMRMWS